MTDMRKCIVYCLFKMTGMGLNDYYNLVTATSYSTLSMLHICIENRKINRKTIYFYFHKQVYTICLITNLLAIKIATKNG